MKKTPYPDKLIKTDKEAEDYIVALVWNTLSWLELSGYIFHVFLPGSEGFKENIDAGACIIVKYPYMQFDISIQKHTVDQIKKMKDLRAPGWKNIERCIFHECIHILLWRMEELATKRYVTPTDISEEDEKITDHFTNVITGMLDTIRKHGKKGKTTK